MKVKGNKLKVGLVALAGLLIATAVTWVVAVKLEGDEPALSINPPSPIVGSGKKLSVTVADPKSGLRRVWIAAYKDGKEVVLLDKAFPSETLIRGGAVRETTVEVEVEPKKIGLTDGKATLRVMALDYAWRNWWHGNRSYRETDLVIDTRPPEITVLTRAHYINRGGTGLVIYKLSESCPESGVLVGDRFFPGHFGRFGDPLTALAFFAVGHDQERDTQIAIRAADRAGNSSKTGFPFRIRRKTFRKDTITIDDRFLNWKMPEFDAQVQAPAGGSLLDTFLLVNGKLRQNNFALIQQICARTEKSVLWDGAFSRLPNAANRARFADRREYVYNGRVIDHQVHLGIDLASVAHSPVPAANSGKVAFAEAIGIYGKSVLIDHGFGLFSMYSHLSAIDVQPGQMVEKNQLIGKTGKTGLAGGDHLHFSVLVHNTFVNPVEWWDPAWIRNNITAKIDAVGTGAAKQ